MRKQQQARGHGLKGPGLACAKAWSTVCTTLEEVQVMVGTWACASALVFKEVLMYTTCSSGAAWHGHYFDPLLLPTTITRDA